MVVPIIVREVMQPSVQSVSPDTPLGDLAERFQRTDTGAFVVTSDETPVGIVTGTDIIDHVATGEGLDDVTAEQVMSSPVITVAESAPIRMAATKLFDNDVDQVPVTEGERVVGMLRTADLSPYLPEHTMSRSDRPIEAEERDWEAEYVDEDQETPGVAVGDVVRFSKPITERDLELFAEVSGDKNPLHLNEEFAEGTRFKRRIVHGALASSVISAALSKLPGLVIYLSQSMTFSDPVEIGERITAECEVIEALGHNRYRLKATEVDETDTEVISGEAVVLIDSLPEDQASE
ncbi:MAG: CBS domain-containing protein [Halorientalis sp.]